MEWCGIYHTISSRGMKWWGIFHIISSATIETRVNICQTIEVSMLGRNYKVYIKLSSNTLEI